jgi:hypothetical protein
MARKPPPKGVKKTSWKKGQSGNPKGGRPPSDKTWGAIFSEIGNLSGAQAARRCHSIAGQLAGIGDKITLKEAVVMRVYSALLFEPSGSLLEKAMDRMDGKVPQSFIGGEEGTEPLEILVRHVKA